MQPHKSQLSSDPAALAILLLAAAALLLMAGRAASKDLQDQLRIERHTRQDLQQQLQKRENQLDGALAEISKLGKRNAPRSSGS